MASFDRQESRRPSAGPYGNWTFIDNRECVCGRTERPLQRRSLRLAAVKVAMDTAFLEIPQGL